MVTDNRKPNGNGQRDNREMSRQGFMKRLCEEERQPRDVRNAAAEFFRVHGVPQQMERALNELLCHEPDDLHGYLANYFTNLSMPPRISRLKGRTVYDAAGQLTVETEVFCIVCNKEKSMSSAAVSGYFGPKETSLDWRAESQERADHVMTAIQWINEPLNNMLNDQNPCDQSQIDLRLSNFFMERYAEGKDIWSKEENCSLSNPEVVLSPPLLAQTKDKKTVEKGKKSNTTEKVFPPAEPPEKVLPGSLAIGSISLAVAKTGAQIQGIPLYKYISALRTRKAPTQFHIPVVLVTLLSCGKNSPGKLSLLEEIILIPKAGQGVKQIITMILELQKEMMRIINTSTKSGFTQAMCDRGAPAVSYERPEQPLDLITEACTNVGLALGTDIHIALNCAAPGLMDFSKGKYEVATGVLKSPDELVEMYQNLISRYPAVVALIDPFRREDTDQWEKLTNVTGDSCSLISDITYKSKAPALPGVRGHISKHRNEITVSDLIHITSEHRGSVLMGVTCNEPCSECSLPDIAVGLGLDYVKLGGLSGAERMTKYNRLISIEEELAQQGILVSKEKHGPPLFTEKPQESITDESSLP